MRHAILNGASSDVIGDSAIYRSNEKDRPVARTALSSP